MKINNLQGIMNRFNVTGLSLVFLCLIVVLISGCATTSPIISMAVDSIVARNASSKGKTYVITSAMQNTSESDLEFQEVARYVDNALSSKGYVRTDNKENANLLICLGYGIGTPQKSYQTNTKHGMVMPIYGIWMSSPSTTTTIEITSYVATLVLEAYDPKDLNKKSQLWKTTTKLTTYKPDVRAILPFMVAASSDYFGINTEKQITVTIREDDPRVLNVRK